jgi:hypothetical protein
MSEEIEALRQSVLLNRAAYFGKVRDTQISSDRQQEQQVKIVSYDPSILCYNVRHPNGTLGFAKAISNSSSLHKGAYVSLIHPAGTQTAIIDTVPRG